ncbi:NAD(P)H-hydrate dehydratase [Salinibacterium sp. dk2585]|uniref:ADP-dependent NAD(P)H-hydrate dehydratase n=1 Tax=unclassified Salinibacterium TaxID=2632331 RepID=UPI0011C25050|nr:MULTISPECIES: ADP/ATP-dependent (S)-NAD(P)H-hydrate dehydratase [unclassified Salinibacterium]QEE61799.1 NAD(P)H-hydrate dehydratase [Salinibacterium sp. dk2585]TXK54646.1 NAD(P)H-hydrate dehydratase [Salinibacterium sp. dk5596]
MRAPVEWTPRDTAAMIATPTATDDKYSRGVLGVVTGSDTYPGAAVLGVDAALATGVGMVRYLGPERPTALVLQSCPEVVTQPGRVQAWLAGSGAGADRTSLWDDVVTDAVPAVLDAGALSLVHEVAGPSVLTPHHRELARLMDLDTEWVASHPARAASEAAASLASVVLLKGNSTLVATPGGELIACPPASPWLATAGTGDVLAGILGALVATHARELHDDERMLARVAASASVIHAEAASRASAGGPFTVRALIAAIPAAVAGFLA